MAALERGDTSERERDRDRAVDVRTDGREARDGRDVPSGLVDELASAPAVRPERVAEVLHRLEDGLEPSADDVAGKLVGRLICDRLR